MTLNGEIIASVEVKNTGDVAGEEVVQLYVRDMVGSLGRPVKELKGFEKIHLKAGASTTVNFIITADLLQFYTANNKWKVEPGTFNVWIGGDSTIEPMKSFSVVE